MKKLWRVIKGIFGMLAVTAVLFLCWAIAYWVAPYGFEFFNFHPNLFWTSIIYSEFGLLIFGMIMFIITRITKPEKRQKMFWYSLQNTIEQIARGDFNAKVNVPTFFGSNKKKERHQQHPFHQLAESINHMASQLGEMEHMRQEFVSNVSHEIQSPLTSISGFAGALQEGNLNEKQRKHYLEIIEMESKRLSKLSENLLKLTSLESEHHPYEPEKYRLDKQIRDIVLSCEPQWTKKSIDMDISLDNVIVRADKDLMGQVWMNLLGNAIKFTSNGGTVSVQLSQQENEIIVRISDTGIGMDEEERLHMFERFYKADKSRSRTTGGSGLGLSIVKKIIDMHEGEINVESIKGEGTEMGVTLPGLHDEGIKDYEK